MRSSILFILGAAAAVLGSPVPDVSIGAVQFLLEADRVSCQAGAPDVVYETFTATRIYHTLVDYSPWLVDATDVITWTVAETPAPTPAP